MISGIKLIENLLKKEALDAILYNGLLFLAVTLPVSIAAANITASILLLAWILKMIRYPTPWESCPLLLPIAAFFAATAFSALFGLPPRMSLRVYAREPLVLIYFLACANIRDFRHARKIITLFIITSALTGLLGIIQYGLGQSDTPLRIFHLCRGRAHGTRCWPLTYAEGILMALPPAIYAFLDSGRRTYYPVIIALALGLLFSFSRMVWISALLLSCVIFLSHPRRLAGLLLTGLVFVLLADISSVALPGRINMLRRAQHLTDPVRLAMWKTGLAIHKDYPLFGVGVGNIEKVYPAYYRKLGFPGEYYILAHLHNNFIHVLVEKGLAGLAAFLALFAVYFRHGVRRARKAGGRERFFICGCLFGVAGFFLSGVTEYSFGDSEIQMIMWFLMALTFTADRIALPRGESYPSCSSILPVSVVGNEQRKSEQT